MSLNIKDAEVHQLARAISQATGESMTSVVRQALRERYARLQRRKERAGAEELLAIADRTAALLKRPHADHAELLYDENGLPKRIDSAS